MKKLYEITNVERPHPGWYDETHPLSREDQKFIWKSTLILKEDEIKQEKATNNENGSLNGSVNGSRKQQGNSRETLSKQHAIQKLKQCNYEGEYLNNSIYYWSL